MPPERKKRPPSPALSSSSRTGTWDIRGNRPPSRTPTNLPRLCPGLTVSPTAWPGLGSPPGSVEVETQAPSPALPQEPWSAGRAGSVFPRCPPPSGSLGPSLCSPSGPKPLEGRLFSRSELSACGGDTAPVPHLVEAEAFKTAR